MDDGAPGPKVLTVPGIWIGPQKALAVLQLKLQWCF